MTRIGFSLAVCVLMVLVGSLFVPVNAGAKTVYIGGTMSLTGPYAEDSAAVLAAFRGLREVRE